MVIATILMFLAFLFFLGWTVKVMRHEGFTRLAAILSVLTVLSLLLLLGMPGYAAVAYFRNVAERAADTDSDGIPSISDNCPAVANPTQQDSDGDGSGDACNGSSDQSDDHDVIEENNESGQTDTDCHYENVDVYEVAAEHGFTIPSGIGCQAIIAIIRDRIGGTDNSGDEQNSHEDSSQHPEDDSSQEEDDSSHRSTVKPDFEVVRESGPGIIGHNGHETRYSGACETCAEHFEEGEEVLGWSIHESDGTIVCDGGKCYMEEAWFDGYVIDGMVWPTVEDLEANSPVRGIEP